MGVGRSGSGWGVEARGWGTDVRGTTGGHRLVVNDHERRGPAASTKTEPAKRTPPWVLLQRRKSHEQQSVHTTRELYIPEGFTRRRYEQRESTGGVAEFQQRHCAQQLKVWLPDDVKRKTQDALPFGVAPRPLTPPTLLSSLQVSSVVQLHCRLKACGVRQHVACGRNDDTTRLCRRSRSKTGLLFSFCLLPVRRVAGFTMEVYRRVRTVRC